MARRRTPRRQKVNIVDLHSAVADVLESFSEAIHEDAVAPSCEDTAEKTVEYLRTHGNYQDITGEYRKSFRSQTVNTPRGSLSTVYSESPHYRLTHLIENGHAVAGGTKRTLKFPHWKPAEKYAIDYFQKTLVKNIEGVDV